MKMGSYPKSTPPSSAIRIFAARSKPRCLRSSRDHYVPPPHIWQWIFRRSAGQGAVPTCPLLPFPSPHREAENGKQPRSREASEIEKKGSRILRECRAGRGRRYAAVRVAPFVLIDHMDTSTLRYWQASRRAALPHLAVRPCQSSSKWPLTCSSVYLACLQSLETSRDRQPATLDVHRFPNRMVD